MTVVTDTPWADRPWPDLPVAERRQELVDAVREHQVVVVAGETGSGKSTQLPRICLEAGRGTGGLIGHTQPRRLAARTIAERVAEELGGEVGGLVGYAVRFTDRVGEGTRVKVMTDGLLLAELQRDRDLRRYDTLIIDEAHERSLNVDFLLGYLHQLLPRRPDLKLIVTSATIDTARFAEHFGGAPVVEVEGRTYPVEVRYRPFGEDDDRDQTAAIGDALTELAAEGPGDVLVFLSGEREIRDTAESVERLELPHTEVLPLYARLSAAEQHRVFRPHRGRRVVLATNVAETSLTVPGIRAVIDPGTARVSRYNRRTKVQRLPIEPVSQASADQRAGRCGRVGPGTCIRLYDEEDYEYRPRFTEPEVLRTNLASVILQMTAIGLGDVGRFPFLEPPDDRSISDGYALLDELGALGSVGKDGGRRLTDVGRRLARLPVDPRLGRMVLEADANGCVAEVLVIAAALAIQDPRERPADKRQEADEAHARFAVEGSDFLPLLQLWAYLGTEREARSSSGFRRLCRREFLSWLRLREWQDVHGQLRIVARSLGIRSGPVTTEPEQVADAVHRSLLAGLLSHVGHRDDRSGDARRRSSEYEGARQARFAIAPGSALARRGPSWVMVGELVETNRLWGRTAAGISPGWAEQLGSHLVKRSYGEPWWDAKRASATTTERVTLFGLPLVTDRRVQYGRIDPDGARDLFLRHALVDGEWTADHAFRRRNTERVQEVRSLEDRVRRTDLLVDPEVLVDWFDTRVPHDVTDGRRFDRWWRDERHRDPHRLDLTVADLVDPDAGHVDPDAFPTTWRQGDLELPLDYVFDPASDLDGVVVDIPLADLDRLGPGGFEWHVPGHREALVLSLLRTLPKELRRAVVPAAEHAAAFVSEHSPSEGPLLDVLADELFRRTGALVPPAALRLDHVPDQLRPSFRVRSDLGRALGTGKDLVALRERLRARLRPAVAPAARALERNGLTDWTIGTLPRRLDADVGGLRVAGFPALVDEGATVGVRVLESGQAQAASMGAGTRRLLLLAIDSPSTPARSHASLAAALVRRLPRSQALALASSPFATAAEVVGDCVHAALDRLVADAGGPAWDRPGFDRLVAVVPADLTKAGAEAVAQAADVLAAARRVAARSEALSAAPLQPALTDVAVQVARLTGPGFASAAGVERLPDLVRYLRAAEHRLERLPGAWPRDREAMARVHEVEQAVDALRDRRPSPEAVALRWAVEELRVSRFAQPVGARGPVSERRILREVARLESG